MCSLQPSLRLYIFLCFMHELLLFPTWKPSRFTCVAPHYCKCISCKKQTNPNSQMQLRSGKYKKIVLMVKVKWISFSLWTLWTNLIWIRHTPINHRTLPVILHAIASNITNYGCKMQTNSNFSIWSIPVFRIHVFNLKFMYQSIAIHYIQITFHHNFKMA